MQEITRATETGARGAHPIGLHLEGPFLHPDKKRLSRHSAAEDLTPTAISSREVGAGAIGRGWRCSRPRSWRNTPSARSCA